jgi:hypothetical protein
MVHALELARRKLVPGGALVCIQPHATKRGSVAITALALRQPVSDFVNPAFQPRITAAMAAIGSMVEQRRLALVGTTSHRYRVRVASLAALRRYMHLAANPPRFPAGGAKRLRAMWRARPEGARIEVSEFFTIVALRAL